MAGEKWLDWRSPQQWLSWTITAVFLIIGLWYILSYASLAEIWAAFTTVNWVYLLLSLATMIVTLFLKAWRWQVLLATPAKPLPFKPLFWAMSFGQYINLVVPLLRLGEVARTYALDRQFGSGKIRTFSTLLLEKVLDLLFFAGTAVFLLPFLILPTFIGNPTGWLAGVVGTAVLLLYLLAYQTPWVIHLSQKLFSPLPAPIAQKAGKWLTAGVAGFAALQNRRALGQLMMGTAVITALSILTPYFLFPALHIPFGLMEATALHIGVSLASTPPSTPGKIGVFNAAAALLLLHFGLTDEALIISYTLLFHLVVILPQLLFGGLAAHQLKTPPSSFAKHPSSSL